MSLDTWAKRRSPNPSVAASDRPAAVRRCDDVNQGGGAVGDGRDAVRHIDVDGRGEVLARDNAGANRYAEFVQPGRDGGDCELGAYRGRRSFDRSPSRRTSDLRPCSVARANPVGSWRATVRSAVDSLTPNRCHVVERRLGRFADVLQQHTVEIQPFPRRGTGSGERQQQVAERKTLEEINGKSDQVADVSDERMPLGRLPSVEVLDSAVEQSAGYPPQSMIPFRWR